MGQLADDGCKIILNKNTLNVYKNYKNILTGFRNKHDGLWDIPLPINASPRIQEHPPTQKLNIIIHKNQTKRNLMQYLHASLFSPTKSTLLTAIKNGNFIGWPGFSFENASKHLSETPATAKGHLDQHRQNLQSTKHSSEDFFPTESPSITHQVVAALFENKADKKGYFDLTGPFPYTSSRGNRYVFVLYDYDSNAILTAPLKSKTAGDIKDAWIHLHSKLHNRGVAPTTYIMDNEASKELKQAIIKYKINAFTRMLGFNSSYAITLRQRLAPSL